MLSTSCAPCPSALVGPSSIATPFCTVNGIFPHVGTADSSGDKTYLGKASFSVIIAEEKQGEECAAWGAAVTSNGDQISWGGSSGALGPCPVLGNVSTPRPHPSLSPGTFLVCRAYSFAGSSQWQGSL